MAFVASAALPPPIAAQASASPELSYVFRFQRQPEPRLAIEARFKGGPQGFTVLGSCLSPWPDLPDCGQAVGGVTVRSERSGKLLPLEHPEPGIWTCDHPPREPLVVRYELAPAHTASAGPALAPAVNAGSILFLGDTALLVPEHLVSRSSVEIHYAWDGPLPVGWTAASSFAVGAPAKTVRLPVSAFLQSLFFWGPVHPYEASPPGEPPLRVAWLGAEPARTAREAFLARLTAIRGAVSRYLGQEVDPAATFFVLPSAAGRVFAVTLTASILLLADSKALAGAAEESVKDAVTAAHELVHTSPAGKIKLTDAPVPPTFLTEALAEFIARRALYRAGLIGPQDWADIVSAKLSESAASASPTEPYVRGDLLVILLDSEIRRTSRGQVDVLALIHSLLRRSHDGQGAPSVSWSEFRGSLAELTSASFVSTVEDILERHREVRLPRDLFAGCLDLVKTPVRAFDPGFEIERSIAGKRVVGVRPGGAAWKAGLRDDDTLLEWSVQWNRSDVPVRFVVTRRGERRSVTYLPQGSAILGSRQRLVPAPDATGCGGVL